MKTHIWYIYFVVEEMTLAFDFLCRVKVSTTSALLTVDGAMSATGRSVTGLVIKEYGSYNVHV